MWVERNKRAYATELTLDDRGFILLVATYPLSARKDRSKWAYGACLR